MSDAPFSVKIYRLLLHCFPAGFREEYAAPMERAFRDELAESGGVLTVGALWVRLLLDLVKSIPPQLGREVKQDTRHTLRLWRARRWHTSFAIGALALGIGLSTGIFSVVNALLLRSLPFYDPGRLASLEVFFPPPDSAKQFDQWRHQSAYLADAALFEESDLNLGSTQEIRRAHVAQTSSNFFSLLGTAAVIGRTFIAGEDSPGRNAVAVIGYGLWQQMFAGDGRVLGSMIRVNGLPLTIVGVAPPGFDFPGKTVLWKAAEFMPGNNGWGVIARLQRGVTWRQAGSAFAAEAARFSPDLERSGVVHSHPRLVSLQQQLAGPAREASLLLLVGVMLILLIACAHVANLLLARTIDRRAELSIRSALGASRGRLIQQLLTESLLLSTAAAGAGLVIAFWTTTIAKKVHPTPLGVQAYSVLDGRVLGFAVGLSLASGLLFGVLPALEAGRIHHFDARGSSADRSPRLVRQSLVAVQVMLTLILLATSASVGRAFVRLVRADRGFDVRGLITVSVSLGGTIHQGAGRPLAYFEEALSRIRRLPGVQSASATDCLPLGNAGFMGGPFGLDGGPPKSNSMAIPVFADYFETVGGRIIYGREFNDSEVRSDARVAVASRHFARQFGHEAIALGHKVTIGNEPPRKIIGVVARTDYLSNDANESQVFLPAHAPGDFIPAFVVRVKGSADRMVPTIREAIRNLDPQVPLFGAQTMAERLNEAFSRPKFYRSALFVFAGWAVLLAATGIHGVVSYAVSQRRREMGVRLALGATAARLRLTLFFESLLPVAVGATLGLVAVTLTGRFLGNLVEGAKSADPTNLAVAILLMALISTVSIWTASRRITGMDITEVVRAE